VSSTLTTPLAWSNSTLLGGDLLTAITGLKHGDGGPILGHGSLTLVRGLLDANLVDDLRLMLFPVAAGGSFPGRAANRTHPSGPVVRWEPAG
jgi:dihydrofolate reductase